VDLLKKKAGTRQSFDFNLRREWPVRSHA
jgi:hypothetical protein